MIKVACIPVFRVTTSLALALAAGAVALGTACSPTKYAVGSVMVPVLDNARVAAFSSEDIQTFRDAAPANLFLLEGLIETGDLVLKVTRYPGPLVLVIGSGESDDLKLAAGLAAAYSDAATDTQLAVSVQGGPEPTLVHLTTPPKSRFKEWLV